MMRRFLLLAVILMTAAAVPTVAPPLSAQVDTAAVAGEPLGQAEAGQLSATMQEAPMLPRSMRPFYHVFAAFGLAWALILAYAVSVRRRMARLEEELQRLVR